MSSDDLESLQAERDAAAPESDATAEPTTAEGVATEETVTTPEPGEEGDAPAEFEEEGEPSEPPESEEEETVDPLGLAKWVDQDMPEFGGEDATRFKNDREFVRSLLEARKLVGQRDDDAQLLKQIRDHIGEDGLKGLLAEESAPPATSKPARDDNLPRSVDEYMLLQEAAGRPDATPAVRDKFAVAQKAFLERFLSPTAPDTESIRSELAKTISETVAKEMKQYRQTVEEERSQERTVAAESRWMAENCAKLYVDEKEGSAMTPLGKRMAEIYHTDPDVQNLPQLKKWRLSLKLATAKQPVPNQPRKPSQRAHRQAPVKTGTPKEQTKEERLAAAPSVVAFLEAESKRLQQVEAQ